MASDHVTTKNGDTDKFTDMARQELAVTAKAFFAPVFGAVTVVRGLLAEPAAMKRADHPPTPKKDAA
jgi:hypothetical protein